MKSRIEQMFRYILPGSVKGISNNLEGILNNYDGDAAVSKCHDKVPLSRQKHSF